MYALPNSLLKEQWKYRGEMYKMQLLAYNVTVDIDLKIFHVGDKEVYSAEYEIERSDGKRIAGACMNRSTKEATIEAVETAVIRTMKNKNQYWR